jgi:ATP-dependent Zn protease
LVSDINEGKVKEIVVLDSQLEITYKNGEIAKSRKEEGISLRQTLIDYGLDNEKFKDVDVKIKELSKVWDWLGPLLIFGILPLLSLFIFFWFIFRQARVGASQAFDFTRARARVVGGGIKPKEKITFNDIGGLKEAKEELKEVVDFLKNPKKYLQIGAKIPRGVLLIGAPGTGKTLLARAVACEAGVPFFSISGSEFIELFVGVGAARVRSLFEQAKKAGRAIIFIDEIDAIGRVRGPAITGAHEEREQTLNQILAEMDGFEREDGRIVMAASVAGDTPVLIKERGVCKLLPISKVIDPYYKEGEERVEKLVEGIEVLGFERKIPKQNRKNIYFKNSAFKKVRSVYRHKVNEIYEVEYQGGKIKTTGNHSLFIRSSKGLQLKPVSQLKPGDVLVGLPFKEKREIRAHKFNPQFELELSVWRPVFEKFEPINHIYQFVLSQSGKISQTKLGKITGFAQTTISQWQRGLCGPRVLSKNYFQHKEVLPEKVKVTPDLMRLFGYYVAEGYARKEIDFCLNRKEKEKIEDIKNLMKKIFNLEPSEIRLKTPGAINIVYYCKPLASFFAFHCGKGAENKHLPSFLFEAPFEYFREFLRGYLGGDGYVNKKTKKGEITSVSKQLILELNWLFRMHGFKSYISSFRAKEGRRVKNGKPLKETLAWRIGFGKTQNPLNNSDERIKGCIWRPIVKSVKKIPYNGYVYDFCGCQNEAFFAGENPILAHNTNRPDMLDPALLRPGRFDRRIVLDLPDVNEREEILRIHCRGKPLALNVNLREIAERTPGFSGADLENVVNEAAILAARKNKTQIFQEDLLESIDKVLLGPERKSHVLSKKEKEIAAFHEAGHALTAASLHEAEPVRKISIVARGLAAGYTLKMPTEERKIKSKKEFLAEIMTLLGGYCAERIKFGEISSGAANDLKEASNLARKLVKEYGMSSLGPISFGEKEEAIFLGREFFEYKNYSEKIAEKIDKETIKIINQSERKVTKILKRKRKLLEKIAKKLIEKETIEKEEFEKLIGKKRV